MLKATYVPDAEVQLGPDIPTATLVTDNESTKEITTPLTQNSTRSNTRTSSTRELEEMVLKASQQSNNKRKSSTKRKSICTLSQLRISNMKLHGRENDMKLLLGKLLELKKNVSSKAHDLEDDEIARKLAASEQQSNNTNPSILPSLVLVSGISGTGKSSLVMKGIKEPAHKMGINFTSGKFDINNNPLPLSAFVDAMVSLSRMISEGDKEIKEKIQNEINETFIDKDLLIMLCRALPGCGNVFFPSVTEHLNDEDDDASTVASQQYTTLSIIGREAISRLQYAIRLLLKIICTNLQYGLVLFLDDLQWSDVATLDLLKSICLDGDIPRLLLVGAYRSDEVPESHPLAIHIREFGLVSNLSITSIQIGNLTSDDVTSLVAEAMGMEDNLDDVRTLANTIHKKTEGNAFYVLVFLRSLYDDELLKYNFAIMKWTWDDDEVKAKFATSNVAAILLNKLQSLNPRTQNVVKVASCLGAKFSLSAVAAITDNMSQAELSSLASTSASEEHKERDDDDNDGISSLDISISELDEEGLWERDSRDVCHFEHDNIQSAAYGLIPEERRDSFKGKIGTILMRNLDQSALDNNLFEVVSLRNCVSMDTLSNEDRMELASLNLRAGMKASENAAFDSAAVYFKAGRKLLGPRGWETLPETMLQLTSEGANACYISGDNNTMNELITEVMNQDIPIERKFNVYEVKSLAEHATSNLSDSIDTCNEFRKLYGLPTIKNKQAHLLVVIKEFMKVNRALGKRTAEDLANLPELTDERIVMGQKMLELMLTPSYQSQPTMYPLIVFEIVKASLKYGINSSSANAFACYGLILCAFGKLQEGQEMSKAVQLICAKYGMSHMLSRCAFVCEGAIHHWNSPLQGTFAPLLEGYQAGLRSGDNESAGKSAFHMYYSGRSLDGLYIEMKAHLAAIHQLNQMEQLLLLTLYLRLVEALLGITDIESHATISSESGGTGRTAFMFVTKLELFVFFQSWDKASKILLQTNDVHSALAGFFPPGRFAFLEALISIKSAQSATAWLKRRWWKKKACNSIKILRGWIKKGDVNLVHYLHLVEAEYAALQGKSEQAESNYKAVIAVASRNGFVQDRALAHELASAYFESKGDTYWKDHHMERCKEYYLEWGATAKLRQLNR